MWKARFACGVNSIGAGSILRLRLDQAQQVLPVGVVLHRLGDAHDVVRRDVAHAVRDLLDAGDHESLALLDRLDERRGLQERLVSARVEPRDPAAELLDAELSAAEVRRDRKSTRLNSSHVAISYAVFCLKKKISGSPLSLSLFYLRLLLLPPAGFPHLFAPMRCRLLIPHGLWPLFHKLSVSTPSHSVFRL